LKPVLVIHGGAGVIPQTFPPEKIAAYKKGLSRALGKGFFVLANGGSAIDAATAAVLEFERDPLFNAGKGAVYTADETHEMDAAIMNGRTLDFGAACTVRNIKHPIRLARAIMEHSPHLFLSADGAEAFAREKGLEFVDNSFFDDAYRYEQLLEAKAAGVIVRDHDIEMAKPMGTVGAVALDASGNLAAATSTGGTTNKACGRVGDTPIPGAGTYADNRTCAVSCTGFGEEFMIKAAAYDVHARMIYQGLSLEQAAQKVVFEHLEPGSGGLIALDGQGNFALPFNTPGMFRGVQTNDSEPRVNIWE
jgi:L-asparaginase / beta-aspartyl-peptidase